jgi:hypothetical protein
MQGGGNLLNKLVLVEKVFHTLLATMPAIALVAIKIFFKTLVQ